jgi:hypothetical protein
MLSKDLSMLSLVMALVLKLVEYLWSYDVWKFDDAYLFCSILDLYGVLVKTIVGLCMDIAC